MGWSFDGNSRRRDKTVPVEYDLPLREPIPLRGKLVRLWRFLRHR